MPLWKRDFLIFSNKDKTISNLSYALVALGKTHALNNTHIGIATINHVLMRHVLGSLDLAPFLQQITAFDFIYNKKLAY